MRKALITMLDKTKSFSLHPEVAEGHHTPLCHDDRSGLYLSHLLQVTHVHDLSFIQLHCRP